MLLIEEYGAEIEADLWAYGPGWDLLDFFRGRHPWPQLYRFLANRCPPESAYHAAVAMDPEIGWERAQRPRPDFGEIEAPTPYGYSLPVLLQLKLIDYVKELIRVMPAVFGGTLPPPLKPEPRPLTAEDRIRDQIETRNVHEALSNILGIPM